ncbi:MAG: hypothetical protein GEU77_15910 [Deltaproteobacteria bacterium]|nr:hypothetical protein [Deltaproteobacteria bacterium]
MSAAVLLFVFFLPLHFHYSVTAQVSKECACIQGTRTQLSLAGETWSCAPTFHTTLLIAQDHSAWVDEWTKLENVRGPPNSLSL